MRNLSVRIMRYGCCWIFIAFIPVHLYANNENIGQFETALNSFEVEGLSLGMKQSEADLILTSAGYRLKGKIEKRRYTFYKYIQRKNKKGYRVEIYTPPENSQIETLKIILSGLDGQQTLESVRQRILKTFGENDEACESSKTYIRCHNFTDTNKLIIEVRFVNKSIQYTLQDQPSPEARLLADQRANSHSHEKRAETKAVKNEPDQAKQPAAAEEEVKRKEPAPKEQVTFVETEAVEEAPARKTQATAADANEKKDKSKLASNEPKTPITEKYYEDFERRLMSYEVDGISLGMKASNLKKLLISRGFSLEIRDPNVERVVPGELQFRKDASAVYVLTGKGTDEIEYLAMTLEVCEGSCQPSDWSSIEAERQRLIKTFSELGSVCFTLNPVRCRTYTETNELYIEGRLNGRWSTYLIKNQESREARNKHTQAQRMAKAKKLDQQRYDKNIAMMRNALDVISSWDKSNLSQEVKYLAAAKRRLIEINMLPATLDTIDKIQDEYARGLRKEVWIAGSYEKLDSHELKAINAALYKELGYGSYSHMLAAMGNWKAFKAVPLALASYPTTAVGLLQFMEDFKAEVESLFFLNKNFLGSKVLNAKYIETVKVKADEYYISGIREKLSELEPLRSKDYGAFKKLKAIDSDVETLQTLITFDKQWYEKDKRLLYNQYKTTYETTRVTMIQNSLPVLIDWVDSLPPSMRTLKLLSEFTEETFDMTKDAGDVRFRELFRAIGEAQTRCNPEGYARPDIILSLQRGYWGEVKSGALEDIAYFSTTFNKINERCPGIATDGQKRLFDSHVASNTMRAMTRIRHGNPSTQKEAEMAVLLVANAIVNRPGCKTDNYGNITSCITEEESQNLNKALMTSPSGLSDTQALLSKNSCSSEPVKQYIKNLAEHSDVSSLGGAFPSIPKFPY